LVLFPGYASASAAGQLGRTLAAAGGRVATPCYLLPKSIEILFQQHLIAATVIALSARRYRLRTISLICAATFGATHLLVAFDSVPTGYVIRFMAAGTSFGFVVPYLMLRVRNGLAFSYLTHRCCYAGTVLMPHAFYTPGAATGGGP
jgi:hypothetical protein